ncbi:hypothetical protein K470DRAFT_265292 [Piedraia hortae CBS 480.64]|uniref:Uncharacterized protein n=1 Tax=Piedraia hortae CBS 480.64 TaxID=1314780 RepID=A0A6A7BVP8_9PEZI|nr:hypothetical protein K470DRAFT_265292 [Piedraia hortae CBS 480.64]
MGQHVAKVKRIFPFVLDHRNREPMWIFDNVTNHTGLAKDALAVDKMNLGPRRKQPVMSDGWKPVTHAPHPGPVATATVMNILPSDFIAVPNVVQGLIKVLTAWHLYAVSRVTKLFDLSSIKYRCRYKGFPDIARCIVLYRPSYPTRLWQISPLL